MVSNSSLPIKQYSVSSSASGLSIDFVFITALPEERDALLKKLPGHRKLPPVEDDIRTYFQADLPITFADNSTGKYQVIVMCLLGMGRKEAALATADAIRRWQPRYVFIVGIAGGISSGNVQIGDVLISDQIVDYELQKWSPRKIEIRWDVYHADRRLLDACNGYRSEDWQELIQVKRPDELKPNRHTGSIASGDKVIAFNKVLAEYRKKWPRLIGVEMEAAGTATAASESPKSPGVFMVRGVSDLADENKDSVSVVNWRLYACDIAASFAIALLKSGPVPLIYDHVQIKKKRVEVIVEGELSEFTPIRQKDIVNVLAALLKIDPSDIRILKVSPGSIKVSIELPESAANHLFELSTRQDFKLKNLNIKSVMVQDREPVNLEDTVKVTRNGTRHSQTVTAAPKTDYTKWQQLYSAADSRWKDVERAGNFLAPIILLAFLAVFYVVIGYLLFHIESWAPQKINWLSTAFYFLRLIAVIFAPLIAMALGLYFIFKQAVAFMRGFYKPAEDENLGKLINRRLLGVMPVPPPLDNVFKYPFIVIRQPSLAETHWSRWLGGPATLVVYDGVAVYLERGNQFSRVVGPGLPMAFLEQNERIKEVVDLRPQTKVVTVKPWTKDGIQIQLTIRGECQINASPQAVTQSSKFRFPFDPLAVKAAVERMTVKVDSKGELYEASWLEGAWGTITGNINAYVAGHSLDEIFLAPQADRSSNGTPSEDDTTEKIEQILSRKIREELEKTKKSLAQNGVKVSSIQITNVELPKEVQQLREKYWESAKQRIAAVRNSRAEADRIRIREQAHAEAQRAMLNAITKKLEQVDPSNLTEPLILSLSGILDQGLDDPIVRPLIAKESFAVLDRVRKMLNEGF